eukprot:scaffold4224_cov216-Skeletonema_marinoi.AAC.1
MLLGRPIRCNCGDMGSEKSQRYWLEIGKVQPEPESSPTSRQPANNEQQQQTSLDMETLFPWIKIKIFKMAQTQTAEAEAEAEAEDSQETDAAAAAPALTCSETDALLQVKYNITEDKWDSTRGIKYVYPFLNLHLQDDDVEPYEVTSEYETFADLTDYETCLPRVECTQVVVSGLPINAFALSFDGRAVDIGHEFLFDGRNPVTSTEVGTCTKPICQETEDLLEIQYWTGQYSYVTSSFRVEDEDGSTILRGAPSDKRYFLNQTYACLPRDTTHATHS